MLFIKKKVTIKSETGNYLFKILISLKTVGNLYTTFKDETVDHVKKIVGRSENFSLWTLFQLSVNMSKIDTLIQQNVFKLK